MNMYSPRIEAELRRPEPEPRPTAIRANLHLLMDLEALYEKHRDIPDEIFDKFYEAGDLLRKAIFETPATCEADLGDKFRLIAYLLDNEGGEHMDELPGAQATMRDLFSFRQMHHKREFGFPHPLYGGAL